MIFTNNPILKKGDVKIDSDDLTELFYMLDFYQYIVFNNLDMVDKEDEDILNKLHPKYNLLKTKYVLIADCRRQEHLWFELLKMLDNGKYSDCSKDEKIEEFSLKDGITLLNDMILRNRELWDNTALHLGMLVSFFGYDEVRRCIWGNYLEKKGEREKYVFQLEKDEKQLAEER